MKPADSTNLLTLIDSADEHGRVCFCVPNNDPLQTKDLAREWLSTMFMHNALLTLRLDRVKKAITEIDLVLAPVGENHTALVINLAKLLQLPGAAPAQELAEFRELVVAIRAYYEAHPTERVDVQLCNNRDRNGRVYGSIGCRGPDGENRAKADHEATAKLEALISASPALKHWLRQIGLSLQKIGPWSWAIVREDDLFGYSMGPHAQHVWKNIMTEAKSAAPKPEPEKLFLLDV